MEIVVRRAQAEDIAELVRLNGIVQQMHVDRRPDFFRVPRADEVVAWFEARLTDPDARVWVATLDGRSVGYVLALFHTREASPFTLARRWCEVDQIAVEAAARRRGVARALVETLAREAEASGVAELKAQTWGFNEGSRRTFERLGFEVESIRIRRDARGGSAGAG